MRIVIVSGIAYENPTVRAVINGLGSSYSRLGHAVTGAALHPRGRRSGARSCPGDAAAPWGTIRCLTARDYDRLDRELRGTDLVHFHHYLSHVDEPLIACWRSLRRARKLAGVTFQDYANPMSPHPPPRDRAVLEAFLSEARWVTTLSRCCATSLERDMPFLAGRVAVVPDGFDPEELASSPERSGPAGVVCVARLTAYKGIDVLLTAWARVCRLVDDPPVLTLCGPDNERPLGGFQRLAARLGVRRRVRFTGELGRGQVWAELRRSLFAVLPSRHEAFGIAVVEAMAAGKPVLATRSGGPQEIIEPGVTGLLVPAQDPDRLARAIISLLGDPDLRARLGRNAAARAADYRWDAIARRYLDLTRV